MSPTPQFTYIRPESLQDTLELLADPTQHSRLLAGGTDLMVRLRYKAPDFDRVIDISRLPELQRIVLDGDEISIGSGVTYTQLLRNDILQQHAPLLLEAARQIGGAQVRNQGTIGGNIVNAAGGADMLPPLVCLDATVHLRSMQDERSLPLTDFILSPSQTRIHPREALTHVSFPTPPSHARGSFTKLGRQRVSAVARILLAVIGGLDASGRIDYVRFAPGAITPRVQRFAPVENLLLGRTPTPELFQQAAEEAARTMLALAGKRWSSDYKIPALQALTRRALNDIFEFRD